MLRMPCLRLTPILAQNATGSLFVWLLILIAAIIVMFVVVAVVRRRFMTADDPVVGVGFSLGDLRDMHRRGELTNEEYERAKQKIVQKTKEAAERAAQQQAKGGKMSGGLDRSAEGSQDAKSDQDA